MFSPKNILVPTDFSDLSAFAVPYAARLAERLGGSLTLLHADAFVEPIDLVGGGMLAHDPARVDELRALAEQRLEEFAEEHVPRHVPVTRLTRVSSPFAAIPAVAAEMGTDLIAMGTHGRSGWRRALLGSVAETVVKETTVPVLTVRHASSSGGSFSRILCPVNFSEVSRQALEDAWVLASACDAEVLVAHVVEQHVEGGEARFRAWVPPSIDGRLEYMELELGSEPAHHILEFALAESCDLVVMGANRRRQSDTTVIGTTTESITREATIPVLVVAHRDSDE